MTASELRQQLLALAHEALWVHEAIQSRGGPLAAKSRTASATFRRERQRLRAQILTQNLEPIAPKASYDPSFLESTDATRNRVVALLREMIRLHVALIAVTADDERADVTRSLLSRARESVSWGTPAEAWPGLDP